MGNLQTAQIGAAGVLLVQYRLLKLGIDSAAMTTDAGIDLVAYSSRKKNAVTIQVKANLKPKPAGGKGKLAIDWWLEDDSPADLVAVANLDRDQVWLFTREEFHSRAQQKPEGRLHFYFYVEDTYLPRENCHARDYEADRLEAKAMMLIA